MSQFFTIHPENPQERLIKQAVKIIHSGGVMVYPTDSGYAIACHIGDKAALDRICKIRKVGADHNFTLMCKDLSEVSVYAQLPNDSFRLVKANTPGSYTFILKGSQELPRRLLNKKRKTIGIRIPDNQIVLALLEQLQEPLMTSSLILDEEELPLSDPDLIREKLEKHVDLIIDGGHAVQMPTTVVDLSTDYPTILRRGLGDTEPFD